MAREYPGTVLFLRIVEIVSYSSGEMTFPPELNKSSGV